MSRRPGPGDRVPDRWLRDESDKAAAAEGCYFDQAAGDRVIEFFRRFLRHSKGQFAGKPFEALDWQRDFLRRLYGWKRPDGRRRFTEFALWLPKKNGKTTQAAGQQLYHLIADGEAGAEVYSAAADREQASIMYREAAAMVRASPALSRVLDRPVDSRKTIPYSRANGFIKALSAEVTTKEGLNASATFVDEIHAHKTPDLYLTLRYAGRARRQPMLGTISTAGYDRASIGYNLYDFSKKVQAGISPSTNFLAVVYEAPEGSDYASPETWKIANPSYGLTIDPESFAADYRTAESNPLTFNRWLRYSLNVWTQAECRWLPAGAWNACDRGPIDPGPLRAMPWWGGLDLASTTDIAAFAMLFPNGQVLLRAWCPEKVAEERERRDRAFYETWAAQGLITLTPGSSIDFERIRLDMLEIRREFPQLRRINADPWNATDLCNRLLKGDGFPLFFMPQGIGQMNEPCKALEKAVIDGTLSHGGNELLSWAADNAVAEANATGNIRLSKKRSREKIDPMVALVMAKAAEIDDAREANAGRSPYETAKPRRL